MTQIIVAFQIHFEEDGLIVLLTSLFKINCFFVDNRNNSSVSLQSASSTDNSDCSKSRRALTLAARKSSTSTISSASGGAQQPVRPVAVTATATATATVAATATTENRGARQASSTTTAQPLPGSRGVPVGEESSYQQTRNVVERSSFRSQQAATAAVVASSSSGLVQQLSANNRPGMITTPSTVVAPASTQKGTLQARPYSANQLTESHNLPASAAVTAANVPVAEVGQSYDVRSFPAGKHRTRPASGGSQPIQVNVNQALQVSVSQPLQVNVSQPLQVNVSQPQQVNVSQPQQVNVCQPLQVNVSATKSSYSACPDSFLPKIINPGAIANKASLSPTAGKQLSIASTGSIKTSSTGVTQSTAISGLYTSSATSTVTTSAISHAKAALISSSTANAGQQSSMVAIDSTVPTSISTNRDKSDVYSGSRTESSVSHGYRSSAQKSASIGTTLAATVSNVTGTLTGNTNLVRSPPRSPKASIVSNTIHPIAVKSGQMSSNQQLPIGSSSQGVVPTLHAQLSASQSIEPTSQNTTSISQGMIPKQFVSPVSPPPFSSRSLAQSQHNVNAALSMIQQAARMTTTAESAQSISSLRLQQNNDAGASQPREHLHSSSSPRSPRSPGPYTSASGSQFGLIQSKSKIPATQNHSMLAASVTKPQSPLPVSSISLTNVPSPQTSTPKGITQLSLIGNEQSAVLHSGQLTTVQDSIGLPLRSQLSSKNSEQLLVSTSSSKTLASLAISSSKVLQALPSSTVLQSSTNYGATFQPRMNVLSSSASSDAGPATIQHQSNILSKNSHNLQSIVRDRSNFHANREQTMITLPPTTSGSTGSLPPMTSGSTGSLPPIISAGSLAIATVTPALTRPLPTSQLSPSSNTHVQSMSPKFPVQPNETYINTENSGCRPSSGKNASFAMSSTKAAVSTSLTPSGFNSSEMQMVNVPSPKLVDSSSSPTVTTCNSVSSSNCSPIERHPSEDYFSCKDVSLLSPNLSTVTTVAPNACVSALSSPLSPKSPRQQVMASDIRDDLHRRQNLDDDRRSSVSSISSIGEHGGALPGSMVSLIILLSLIEWLCCFFSFGYKFPCLVTSRDPGNLRGLWLQIK